MSILTNFHTHNEISIKQITFYLYKPIYSHTNKYKEIYILIYELQVIKLFRVVKRSFHLPSSKETTIQVDYCFNSAFYS